MQEAFAIPVIEERNEDGDSSKEKSDNSDTTKEEQENTNIENEIIDNMSPDDIDQLFSSQIA